MNLIVREIIDKEIAEMQRSFGKALLKADIEDSKVNQRKVKMLK